MYMEHSLTDSEYLLIISSLGCSRCWWRLLPSQTPPSIITWRVISVPLSRFLMIGQLAPSASRRCVLGEQTSIVRSEISSGREIRKSPSGKVTFPPSSSSSLCKSSVLSANMSSISMYLWCPTWCSPAPLGAFARPTGYGCSTWLGGNGFTPWPRPAALCEAASR